jgi:hypothetical protein
MDWGVDPPARFLSSISCGASSAAFIYLQRSQRVVDARLPTWAIRLEAFEDVLVDPEGNEGFRRRFLRAALAGLALRQGFVGVIEAFAQLLFSDA